MITDLAMPGGSGLRYIDELRAANLGLKILVLTAYCTDEYIRAALSAGADGYVLKDASRPELLQAIRAVISGQKYFSEPVSARAWCPATCGAITPPPSPARASLSASARY